jgi:hypothetical protein
MATYTGCTCCTLLSYVLEGLSSELHQQPLLLAATDH